MINSSNFLELNLKRQTWIQQGISKGLGWCDCPSHSNEERATIEDTLAALAKEHLSAETLSILSVGPGECLQDFILLKRLATIGFKKIEITMLDTNFRSPTSRASLAYKKIAEWVEKRGDMKSCKIELNPPETSYEHLCELEKKYPFIYAVDFDAYPRFETLFLNMYRHSLEQNGNLYISYVDQKIIMTKPLI